MSNSVSIKGYDPKLGHEHEFQVTQTIEIAFELASNRKVLITESELEEVLLAVDTHTPGKPTSQQAIQLTSISERIKRVIHFVDCPLAHQVFISAFHISKAIGLFPPELFDHPGLEVELKRLQGKLIWKGQADCFLYFLDEYFFGDDQDIRDELFENGLLFTVYLDLEARDFIPYDPAALDVTTLTEGAQLKWREITERRSS